MADVTTDPLLDPIPPIDASTEELLAYLRPQYMDVRVLDDGSIAAIQSLLTTTAVFLGLDRWGFAKRFCYQSPTKARAVFNELRTEDDEPTGYIARRPEQ